MKTLEVTTPDNSNRLSFLYQIQKVDFDRSMKTLQQLLTDHATRQSKNPTMTGVEELQAVNSLLSDITLILKSKHENH